MKTELETANKTIEYREKELRATHERDMGTIRKLKDERDQLRDLNQQLYNHLGGHGNEHERAIAGRITGLQGEVESLRKELHYRKSDIQNLVIGIQQQQTAWDDVNKKNEEIRKERRETQNLLATVTTTNERNEAMILEIRKAFDIDLDRFTNATDEMSNFLISTRGPNLNKAKRLVGTHISAKYVLKERLDKKIMELETDKAELTEV